MTATYTENLTGPAARGGARRGVALDILAIDPTVNTQGYLRLWAADQAEPTTVSGLSFYDGITRSNLMVVAVAADGTIKIRNSSSATIDVVIDSQGWYASSTALPQAAGAQCTSSGSRAGTQPVTHQLSDATNMALNPTNGNLALSGSLLHLRGVGQDLSIGWRYNGVNDTRPTLTTGRFETALQPWTDGSFTYVSPDGGCYKFTKSVSTWTTPAGINATLTSPVAGTMTLRMNPSGIVNTYVKTTGVWQLTKSADKNTATPNLIAYTYTSGKLTSITDTQGRVVTFAYTDTHNATQPSTITDTSLSRTIGLVYGGIAGALSQITDATGAVTTLGYDATGLISLTNNTNQTTFGYDATSRTTSWTYGAGSPASSPWTAAYATSTTITDGNGHAATYRRVGTTTTLTDPLSHITTLKWDTHDNLTERTDVLSSISTNTYGAGTNLNNLLSAVTSPSGTTGGSTGGAFQKLTFPTAPTGALSDYQPTATQDAQGNTSTIAYDHTTTQQATSVTDATGAKRTSTFQGDGSTTCGAKTGEVCTTTKGNGNLTTTSYGYDAAGNPTSITPPAPLGARAFSYDAAGRVKTATDGRGNTATYTYDANDRTLKVSYTGATCVLATCVSTTYDAAGNLTSRTSPTGVTGFGYDQLNRPTTKTQAGVLIATATYDDASNLTSYTDTNGTITYGYDIANRLINLAEPGGSCPSQAIPNSTSCTVFDYDNANRRLDVKFPTGQVSATTYDHASRVLAITVKTAGGTTLTSRSYTYQTAVSGGADQALKATMTDQSGTTTYGYDGLNRLTSDVLGTSTSSWTYDNDGNRLTAAKTGVPTTFSAYNGADQLCWSSTTSGSACASPPTGATLYTHDAMGNQTADKVGTTTLANSFNVFNQLTSTIAGATTQTNTYSGAGNAERLSAGATSFMNGTLGVTSETTGGYSTTYIREPDGNLVAMRTAGASAYYTSDNQGSVIALTDAAQALVATYTYDAWGNITTSTLANTNPWRYATSYTDTTTGYLKLGARYYNPTTARFTQPDPAATCGGYTYANDNPTNYTDPSGRSATCDIAAGLATIGPYTEWAA